MKNVDTIIFDFPYVHLEVEHIDSQIKAIFLVVEGIKINLKCHRPDRVNMNGDLLHIPSGVVDLLINTATQNFNNWKQNNESRNSKTQDSII